MSRSRKKKQADAAPGNGGAGILGKENAYETCLSGLRLTCAWIYKPRIKIENWIWIMAPDRL